MIIASWQWWWWWWLELTSHKFASRALNCNHDGDGLNICTHCIEYKYKDKYMVIFQHNLLLQSEAKVHLNHLLASTFGFSPYQALTTKYPNNRKVKQSTCPTVHQNISSEIWNVDSLHDLPVHTVFVNPRHYHWISHICTIVVMVWV